MVTGLIIDDTPSREDEFRGAWGRPKKLSLEFRTPGDFEKGGPDLVNEIAPDIVLIDLILNVVLDNIAQRRFQWEGVVIAAEVKQAAPYVPVYGYSSDRERVTAYNRSDSSHLNFDQVWELSALFKFGHRALAADIADYAKIADKVPEYGKVRRIRPYADLLAPPVSSRSVMEEIIRTDFLDRNSSRTRDASDFSKWVRWVLLTTPGPLKSGDYLAKLLGLSEKGMVRVAQSLGSAQYRGAFYHSSPRLWWAAEVERLLVRRAGGEGSSARGVLSRLAHLGFALKKGERVDCGICNEPYPEAVATSNVGSDPLPVHVRCSHHHFGKMDRLRFDEPREYSRE